MRYASGSGVEIAYQVLGNEPHDVVWVAGAVTHLDVMWEYPLRFGLEIRAGVHTGECEVAGDKLTGIAVHIGARMAGRAAPGEVLVSSTVLDLVAGSGLEFEERGSAELKGVPGEWRL